MPEFDDPTPPHAGVPTTSDDPDIDLFCCHTVFLPDGRLLAVGGDSAGTHDNVSLHVYDPVLERWSKIAGRPAPALPGVTNPTGMIALLKELRAHCSRSSAYRARRNHCFPA
jgi:hypothetical protein